MSEPERLADLLPAVVVELAVRCAVETPTGDLCPVVGPHEQHQEDPTTNEETDDRD